MFIALTTKLNGLSMSQKGPLCGERSVFWHQAGPFLSDVKGIFWLFVNRTEQFNSFNLVIN